MSSRRNRLVKPNRSSWLDRAVAAIQTIAAAAQHDRWATIRSSGPTWRTGLSAVEPDRVRPAAAELRRTKLNHHDVDAPPAPRRARPGDADDIAAVLHYRVERQRASRRSAVHVSSRPSPTWSCAGAESSTPRCEPPRRARSTDRGARHAVLDGALTESRAGRRLGRRPPSDDEPRLARPSGWSPPTETATASPTTRPGTAPESAAQRIDAGSERAPRSTRYVSSAPTRAVTRRPWSSARQARPARPGAAPDPSQRPVWGGSLEDEADFSLPWAARGRPSSPLSTHRLDNGSR